MSIRFLLTSKRVSSFSLFSPWTSVAVCRIEAATTTACRSCKDWLRRVHGNSGRRSEVGWFSTCGFKQGNPELVVGKDLLVAGADVEVEGDGRSSMYHELGWTLLSLSRPHLQILATWYSAGQTCGCSNNKLESGGRIVLC